MKQFIFIITTIFFSIPCHAQIGKKLLKRAEEKISQKAERTIDKIIKPNEAAKIPQNKEKSDDQSDTTPRGGTSEASSSASRNASSGSLRANYSFDYEFHATMTSKNNDPMDLTYFFTSGGELFGFEHEDKKQNELMYTVMDHERRHSLIFMINDGKRSATKMPFMDIGKLAGDMMDEYNGDDYQITKTGRTKSIAGYHCEEYKFVAKKYEGTTWISTETPFTHEDLLKIKSSNFNSDMKMSAALMGGIALESNSYPIGKPHKANHLICTKFGKSDFVINTKSFYFTSY